jgi:hypothetical protein
MHEPESCRPNPGQSARPFAAGRGVSGTKSLFPGVLAAPVLLAVALALAGCGNFWQNPYTSSSDNNNNGDTGTTSTTIVLTPSANSVAEGASLSLTATVTPAAATGTVTFYDSSSQIGSADLSSGTATFSASFSTTGTQSLTADYGGSSTYAASYSSAVTVTVTASGAKRGHTGSAEVRTGDSAANPSGAVVTNGSAAIHATGPFSASGGAYTARNAEAAVVEGHGSVALDGVKLSGSAGNGRGVLLYSSAKTAGEASFSMTGGSLAYSCDAESTPACAEGSPARGQNNPATLFSVANASANISLDGVQVTNNTPSKTSNSGTLLTAGALKPWGATGVNGGNVTFLVKGTAITGDVIVDGLSTAALSILADGSGQGSTLAGAIDSAGTARAMSLTLDPASLWIVSGNSFVTGLDGLDLDGNTVKNIDGGGHCVFYSGEINGERGTKVYALSGGGYLAPRGTQGLACE